MIQIDVECRSRASPHAVFKLLRDGSTWPRWSLFDAFELEREGFVDPLGIGAVRVFSTRVSRAREEVVEIIPDQRLVYVLLSGFPVLDYRSEVDLSLWGLTGTTIRWRSAFRPKHFGTGWLWGLFLRKAISEVASQLARAAEDEALVADAAPVQKVHR